MEQVMTQQETIVTPETRKYLLAKREALLMELRAIEDYLGLKRTLSKRELEQRCADHKPGEAYNR